MTAKEVKDPNELKNLLIKQIENRVRWRESVIFMKNQGVKDFIEIGPGKVLSGLVKRITSECNTISLNSIEELKSLQKMNFKGKKILITGATGGIGNDIVKKFVSLGGTVFGSGTKDEKLEI